MVLRGNDSRDRWPLHMHSQRHQRIHAGQSLSDLVLRPSAFVFLEADQLRLARQVSMLFDPSHP